MMITVRVTADMFTFGILLKSARSWGHLKAILEVFNEMCANAWHHKQAHTTSSLKLVLQLLIIMYFSLTSIYMDVCSQLETTKISSCYVERQAFGKVASWHFICLRLLYPTYNYPINLSRLSCWIYPLSSSKTWVRHTNARIWHQ